MFQGHYGPAGVLHLFFPDISFAWLTVSTQVIDIAYFALVYSCKLLCEMNVDTCPYPIVCSEYGIYNVELMRTGKPFPTNLRGTFSHSLTGALVLTIPLTILYRAALSFNNTVNNGNGKKTTGSRSFLSLYCILFLGVVSHWILDVLVHRVDMSILPPLTTKLIGYGTWQHWSSMENYMLEIGLVLTGILGMIIAQFKFGRKGGPPLRFWIATLIHLATTICLTHVAYFGTDYVKKADSVIDGSPSSPDQVPLILLTYAVTFIISRFMEVDKANQVKSE